MLGIHAFPSLIPDRWVREECARRFVADDGVQFADLGYRWDRASVCLMEKHKPSDSMRKGFWSVTYEITSEDALPRRADSREIVEVARRVYGSAGHDDNFNERMNERNRQIRANNRDVRHDDGMYIMKRMHKAEKNWRSTTFAGAPQMLDERYQYFCGHEHGLVAAECDICRPDRRIHFS
jgi:hypothetical protein